MNVKIVVAAHKAYTMPDDPIYAPVQVGAALSNTDLGFVRDDGGDNISELNPSFCELTGLYYAWKNIDADYLGLVHYRRHFTMGKEVLTGAELEPYLGKILAFVPKKQHYYIETLESHYAHTHYAEHLTVTREIIAEKYPDYLDAYDHVLRQRSGHMFNMMVLEKSLFDAYCAWLFDVLFALKGRMGQPELSQFQGRFYGRVSEIIFNVWLRYQLDTGNLKKSQVMELRCLYAEKVNWGRKIRAFLGAKFFGKKYTGSF